MRRKTILAIAVVISAVTSFVLLAVTMSNRGPRQLTEAELLIAFAPKLSESVKEAFVELIQRLTNALAAANVTYFMCAGTLLGSYRHHGFIPWDDDVDLCVHSKDKRRVKTVFESSTLSEDHMLYTKLAWWKVYPVKSKSGSTINSTTTFPWTYPFVDIFFYAEQSASYFLFDYKVPVEISRSVIFPLHLRPFVNLKLWAPRDVKTFLAHDSYGDLCETSYWLHNVERPAERVYSVNCSRLWPYFPFVFRLNSSQTSESSSVITTSVEQLKIGDRVIHTIEVESPAAEIPQQHLSFKALGLLLVLLFIAACCYRILLKQRFAKICMRCSQWLIALR